MNDNLSKAEALQLMQSGEKITHKWFDKNEWMTIKNGKLLLEDGVVCDIKEFFLYRDSESWKNGYSLFKQ